MLFNEQMNKQNYTWNYNWKLGTLTISIQFLLCYINWCKNNTYDKGTRGKKEKKINE
jgi:hypothetical protein